MQEKYDALTGFGAQAIAIGERNGIDYFPGAAAEATQIGQAYIDRHGLFDPRHPARVFVDDPSNANEPLRALLNARPDENLRDKLMNPVPGEHYAKTASFLHDSELWRQSYELVGQIVQQNNVIDTVMQVTAQRTLAGAESLSGLGRDPDPTPYNEYKSKPNWLVRNEKTLNRIEGLQSAASFVKDVYLNKEKDYLTIDVFASKTNPEERRFQVRKFGLDAPTNSFKKTEPMANDHNIRKILGER